MPPPAERTDGSRQQVRNHLMIALALPAVYLIHLLEEYYAGDTLPVWLNEHLGTDLSNADFLWINGIAMGIVVLHAIVVVTENRSQIVLLAIVVLFTLNGMLHALASLAWQMYVPGTLSGAVIYVPLGLLAMRRLRPDYTRRSWRSGLVAGVLAHALVIAISQTV